MTEDEKYAQLIEVLKQHGIGPNAAKNQLTSSLFNISRDKQVDATFQRRCWEAYWSLFALDFGFDD